MQNEKSFIKFNNKLKSLQIYDTAQNYNTTQEWFSLRNNITPNDATSQSPKAP
jgi:hypothetical protein